MIPNFKRLLFQAFPRFLALAETSWTSKEDKNYDDFQKRMNLQYKRLEALNIQYHIPPVTGLKDKVAFLDKVNIELNAALAGVVIYYSTDGATPSKTSKKYTAPLEFSQTTTLNTIAYRGNVASETKAALIEKQNYLESLNITPKTGALQRWTGVKQFKIVDSVALPKNATYQFVTVINLAGNEGIEQL